MQETVRRKKRSHEEIVAAREAYAAEWHQRQQEREARKAEREKIAAERAVRKAEREARKNMTAQEVQADRYQRKLAKSRKKGEAEGRFVFDPYEGEIKVGDIVKIRFAGDTIVGPVVKILSDTDEGSEDALEFRKGTGPVTLYFVQSEEDGYKYPVRKEKIISKLQ